MHASVCVYVHTRDSQSSIVIRYCSDTDTNTAIYIRYMVIKVMRSIQGLVFNLHLHSEGQWIRYPVTDTWMYGIGTEILQLVCACCVQLSSFYLMDKCS